MLLGQIAKTIRLAGGRFIGPVQQP